MVKLQSFLCLPNPESSKLWGISCSRGGVLPSFSPPSTFLILSYICLLDHSFDFLLVFVILSKLVFDVLLDYCRRTLLISWCFGFDFVWKHRLILIGFFGIFSILFITLAWCVVHITFDYDMFILFMSETLLYLVVQGVVWNGYYDHV